MPYPLQIAQNQGCNLFAPVRTQAHRYMQKVAMPCSRTGPSQFCAISPEADPLGKNSAPNNWEMSRLQRANWTKNRAMQHGNPRLSAFVGVVSNKPKCRVVIAYRQGIWAFPRLVDAEAACFAHTAPLQLLLPVRAENFQPLPAIPWPVSATPANAFSAFSAFVGVFSNKPKCRVVIAYRQAFGR
jgi:hypothetical protein